VFVISERLISAHHCGKSATCFFRDVEKHTCSERVFVLGQMYLHKHFANGIACNLCVCIMDAYFVPHVSSFDYIFGKSATHMSTHACSHILALARRLRVCVSVCMQMVK
jgi:hypothetical protein